VDFYIYIAKPKLAWVSLRGKINFLHNPSIRNSSMFWRLQGRAQPRCIVFPNNWNLAKL